LPGRRVVDLADAAPAALAERLQALHGERSLPGAAGDVARALDDFHDAAANADEDRYFALLPDDAVFLGTDGTERWTGAAFRRFAMPYFQRASAWTYVTIARAVEVAQGGDVAWFDEALDNASYGECRGSGVLVRRDGRWVLRQYNLTILVPNDLAAGVVKRIRALQGGLPLARTTVVLVRHAEKVDQSTDAALSEAGHARAKDLARALADLPVTAVFASQFARTKDTVAPLCATKGLTAQAIDAKDLDALAAAVRACAGGTVVVCGHSNTLPQLATALGVAEPLAFGEGEHDALHVVVVDPAEGAGLWTLRYGR
jgi:phosphohistidine phosphatase SixA/ketosteroid isomerase-like protein